MKQNPPPVLPVRESFFPVGNPGASTPRLRPAIIPLFLTFAGCPHRCLFCAQDKQTGHGEADNASYPQTLSQLLTELERHPRPAELAFYGGTFTALPRALQEACLALGMRAKQQGLIRRIRCSTRPDALQPEQLAWLKQQGLDLVELGVQSFDTQALHSSRRGYDGETAANAYRLIRESGLDLGIQLLPGMPGSTPDIFMADVAKALSFSPACLRFYPCLVVDGTPLADLWRSGVYAPWNTETTVQTLGRALAAAWAQRIPVIRLSLAPEQELDKAILAGPRHPALGNLIQGEALFESARIQCAQRDEYIPETLDLPRYCQGMFFGAGGALLSRWESLGITRKSLRWIDGEQAVLRWKQRPEANESSERGYDAPIAESP